MKTDDEIKFDEIEARVTPTLQDGNYTISADDWARVKASRLAWRFTAKCFAAADPDAEREALERAIDRMGWPEINAFKAEINRGQSVFEDAGGYMLRCLRRLFGLETTDEAVLSYRRAAQAMVEEALANH